MRILVPIALLLLAPAQNARSQGEARVVLVAGGETAAVGIPATQAKLTAPFGIARHPDASLRLVELAGGRYLKIDAQGVLSQLGGNGAKGYAGDGGPVRDAVFNSPHSLAIASSGDVYIADTLNYCVRRVDGRTGVITTLAGTGVNGYSGDDGPASRAQCSGVYCVALSPDDRRLYLADLENRRVRVVDLATGMITTIAGNGERGVPADGALAKDSPLVDPRAVAVDSQGNVYILERGGHALRVVDASGRIRTVAGTGARGYGGDGGPALQAEMRGPKHLCLDGEENVIIADTDNHVIRKYLPREGRIVAVAGAGRQGAAGVPGPAGEVELNFPHGVFLDADGSLLIVDSMNNRVLRVTFRVNAPNAREVLREGDTVSVFEPLAGG